MVLKNLRTFLKGKVMTKTPKELTEEWKAGELPQWKFYYVLYSGGIEPLLLNGENDFNNHCKIINSLIKEVLAPVPSYNEVQSLEADRLAKNEGEEIVSELKQENASLKGLLKEWVKAYPVVAVTCDLKNFVKIKELLDKTNEVLK